MRIEQKLERAVESFWSTRRRNLDAQRRRGTVDAGARGAVTAGTQMSALETLIAEILCDAGLKTFEVKMGSSLELPGYYRAEKKWDLLAISEKQLVLAMEFKSQVGPSFGKNFNNRSEEVLGSAACIWTAYREGRFGPDSIRPFLGYFFLLEDCPEVHKPVRNKEPHFGVDPVFKGEPTDSGEGGERFPGVSYCRRYELLCRRLVREGLYSSACLLLSTNATPTRLTQPAKDLTFGRFVAAIRGHVVTVLGSRP